MPLFFEIFFVDNPSLKTSMICTWNIPSRKAFETVITGKGIFKRYGKAVADVKIAVGVWWWHNNREGSWALRSFRSVVDTIIVVVNWFVGDFGVENTRSFPSSVNICFVFSRLITACKFHICIITQFFGFNLPLIKLYYFGKVWYN